MGDSLLPAESQVLKQQRTFGVSAALVCAFVAWHQWRHGQVVPAWLAGLLGAALAILGRVAPGSLRQLSAAWWRALHAVGWVNTRIILGAFFFLVFTPVGLLLRATGWDPLALKRRPGEASKWVPSPASHQDPKHYERMY